MRICVITTPYPSHNSSIVSILKILQSIASEIYVITRPPRAGYPLDEQGFEDKVHIIHMRGERGQFLPIVILRHLLAQFIISFKLLNLYKKVDIVIFQTTSNLILPTFFSRLLRKKTVIIFTGSGSRSAVAKYQGWKGKLIAFADNVLTKINCTLSHRLIVYTESLIAYLDLEKYKKKVCSNGARYVSDNFSYSTSIEDRSKLVGYIGRLDDDKAIMPFIRAIPLTIREYQNIHFLIGGDGDLMQNVKIELENLGCSESVTLTGWLSQNDVSYRLDKLKLLVLPTKLEGLPMIVLESMACGTPVLVSPVGGVPDIIQDNVTGFILNDNEPENIAANVIRALHSPHLSEISLNARHLIEEQFTYEQAVRRYDSILNSLLLSS